MQSLLGKHPITCHQNQPCLCHAILWRHFVMQKILWGGVRARQRNPHWELLSPVPKHSQESCSNLHKVSFPGNVLLVQFSLDTSSKKVICAPIPLPLEVKHTKDLRAITTLPGPCQSQHHSSWLFLCLTHLGPGALGLVSCSHHCHTVTRTFSPCVHFFLERKENKKRFPYLTASDLALYTSLCIIYKYFMS